MDPQLLIPVISILGTALLTGVSFILRTLAQQNRAMTGQSQALAVLIARVDPAIANVGKTQALELAVTALQGRVTALETTQQIHNAQMQTSPAVTLTAN